MAGVAGLTTLLLLLFGIEPRKMGGKNKTQTKPKSQSPTAKLKLGAAAFKVRLASLGAAFSLA